MLLYGGLQHIDDLMGIEALRIDHELQQAFVAEEIFLLVLGLVQTIGIDQ